MKKQPEWCPRCKATTETFYNHAGREECGRCAQPRHDPKVKCAACSKEFKVSKQHAYMSGDYYCSAKCYDTLFLKCLACGQNNMAAKTNLEQHGEQLCDPCYNSKHGLIVVTILDPNAGRYHRH